MNEEKTNKKSIFQKIKEMWITLGKPIYVGRRLKQNMLALTLVSIATAILGLIMIIINLTSDQSNMLFPAIITFISGVFCAICAGILKNRRIAIMIPTLFCGIVFTSYAVSGAGEGSAILWSLLLPIGLCYFVSVKNGILLSTYYSLLFGVVFYSPFKEKLRMYYNEPFMDRFPILYAFLSIFTGMAMIQYHRTALLEIDYNESLKNEVARQTAVAEERNRRIEQMSYQTIQTLANAIDAKDSYTKGHSSRVSMYSVKIAEALGWDADRINELRYAALLHDIGKIGVPDSILNNPKKLTDVEYNIIKSHTTMGADILKNKILIKMAEDVARSHHERYDGRGYPDGKKGEEISAEARIVAISDAFDAMRSNRVYRRACDNGYIREELIKGSGKQFDPKYTEIFMKLWDSGALDEITKHDPKESDDRGEVEASSVLLQEVMEAFTSLNTADNIDITTGIMNRTAGEATIANAMKEESGCFAFLDVDNLKKINDIHGHEAGDRVLKLMGEILKENSNDSICCRLGGDEFLFYMKNTSREVAETKMKNIIKTFDDRKIVDPDITVASISAGMTMTATEDTYTKAYNEADKALYHVKQNGKKGYSFYNSDSEAMKDNQVDLDKLIKGIRVSGSYKGAMDVEYRLFVKLYEYLSNMEKRFSQPFRMVLITLENENGTAPTEEELEKAMFYMEQSIRQCMRNVDIITRYSRQQFLLLLLGTEADGVKSAIGRIFSGYYKMNGSGAFSPSYTIADDSVIENR